MRCICRSFSEFAYLGFMLFVDIEVFPELGCCLADLFDLAVLQLIEDDKSSAAVEIVKE